MQLQAELKITGPGGSGKTTIIKVFEKLLQALQMETKQIVSGQLVFEGDESEEIKIWEIQNDFEISDPAFSQIILCNMLSARETKIGIGIPFSD